MLFTVARALISLSAISAPESAHRPLILVGGSRPTYCMLSLVGGHTGLRPTTVRFQCVRRMTWESSNHIRRLAGISGLAGALLFFAGDMLFYGHFGPGANNPAKHSSSLPTDVAKILRDLHPLVKFTSLE